MGEAAECTFPDSNRWPRLKTRVSPVGRDLVLKTAVELAVDIPGSIIEFGVADGESTRVIRRTLSRLERTRRGPRKLVFACDSFQGLTEPFENAAVGTFACPPPRIRGVEIVEGFFEDSLTEQLAHRVGPVALASLDADLYSSTLTALRWLTPLLHTGSLLLFDEYLGEHESERRAHLEWAAENNLETVVLAEFAREPSGWGDRPDRRVLVQVVRDAELPSRRTRWTRKNVMRVGRKVWQRARRIGR